MNNSQCGESPYAKRIHDCLNTNEPVKWVTVQKGQSIGMSSGVISPEIAYMLYSAPTVLPALSDEAANRLDDLIVREQLMAIITPRKKRRRTDKHPATSEQLDEE